MCNYLNASPFSTHKKEDEILLSPYHKYLFVSEKENTQTYVVLPCDLDIPKTYETFISWKNSINNITAPRIIGGRTQIMQNRNFTRKNLKRIKSMPKTRKVNTANKLNKPDDTKRFTDPIPSFVGKPPTPTELDVIKKMVEFFEK